MYDSQILSAGHRDLIHDVAFDWYGTQMATCSSDQTVKVWTKLSKKSLTGDSTSDGLNASGESEDDYEWVCTGSWKSHSGAVWKVTWAHPEFGQVLATCSFDRTAAVWEEVPGKPTGPAAAGVEYNVQVVNTHNSHWVKKTSLVDSRTSVTDVKFAPKHLGLMLATCSADGTVRIYEAPDVMNLSQWTLQHEIPCKVPCSCISWNSSLHPLHPPLIAVGSDDRNPANGGKVFLYEYNEGSRRWNRVETMTTIIEPVNDIAFAPSIGRSYSVLAIASKDLKIITLKHAASNTLTTGGVTEAALSALTGASKYEVRLAGQFNDHASLVWRVCWNVTGTCLASSGDDGQVHLWKSNYLDNWKKVATLKNDPGKYVSHPTNGATNGSVSSAFPPGVALANNSNAGRGSFF